MIAIAGLFLAVSAPTWLPVGVTDTRLRVFVDRNSVRDADGRRRARIRLGAPTSIVGKIVLAYEEEEFDCPHRQWRLLTYEAQDEAGRVVRRSRPGAAPGPMLPAVEHTIGGEVVQTVCALRRASLPHGSRGRSPSARIAASLTSSSAPIWSAGSSVCSFTRWRTAGLDMFRMPVIACG